MAEKSRLYFEGRWDHDHASEPTRMLYEVDDAGNVLRQIEFFADGRAEWDSLAYHADGLTKFGRGSLHATSFFESECEEQSSELSLNKIQDSVFQDEWQRVSS